MPQYPNSPHQPARSPALTNSVPSTPNMGQAMPMQSPQQYGGYPQHYMAAPQVPHPSTSTHSFNSFKSRKAGQKSQKNSQQSARANQKSFHSRDAFRLPSGELPGPFVPKNLQQMPESSERSSSISQPLPQIPPIPLFPPRSAKIDLSPESGNFDQILTSMQNYGYPPQPYDRMTGMSMPSPYTMYPTMQFMPGMPQPQSPQPGYQQPFIPGQYNAAPQPQAMSRTSSQISERPNSSLGQPQTPSMPPSAMHHTPQKPAATTPSAFQRTVRRSAAIIIKNPDGDIVKLPVSKPPASPAPSNVSSKTPPVVVSTPTPPPKSVTPQHARTDSKRDEDVLKEFKEKIFASVEKGEQVKTPDVEAAKPQEDKVVEEVKVTEEKKDTSEADAAAAAAKAKQDEEDELERQIKEMEEAEEAREKAEAELQAKRAAEKAAAAVENAAKAKLAAEENDRKLREQEREMERLEDEREKKRQAAEAKAAGGEVKPETAKEGPATPSTLAAKLAGLKLGGDSGASTPASDDSMGPPPKVLNLEKRTKPAALNLAPLNTKPVEPPQPSAALQSLKSARFLTVLDSSIYPPNIASPNPALNAAVATKGKSFKYDKEFLLQFQKVFTEKPSLEFESQIKALIGGGEGGPSRSGSTRTPGGMGPRQGSNRAPGQFTMGTFGVGKTLPPGTTSQQRFEMSQGTMPRPGAIPVSGSFRSTGTFPGGMPTGRQPSAMGVPPSPRMGGPSRGGRQGSKRDTGRDSKHNVEAEKKMPLTAGMVLKPIEVSATGWKPRSIVAQVSATGAAGPAPGGAGAGHMDPEMVQRKVKAALNKMTPEKFDKIADQILVIAAQSKDEADGRTLRQVIQLTFEKATDEAHWASMYAKFCKRMLETMSPEIRDESILDKNGNVVSGGNLFRKYLLNRCQEEFERGWKMDLPEKPEGERGEEKTEEAVMLSDEYYIAAAAKRRGLGLVQFIGELYKLGMLTERIMHECVKKLVDYTGVPDEAEIESLTKLLKTIGGNLDSTEKGRPMMDMYFSRIKTMIGIPELPSRLNFMLMDILDLRAKKWVSKEANKGPKTLEEVRAEVRNTILNYLCLFHSLTLCRLRLLPHRRLLRMLADTVEAPVVDACRWVVVILAASPINMATSLRLITPRTPLPPTISVA